MSKKSVPLTSPNGYCYFFFLIVLAKLFSARFTFIAKPTDQKQNNDYRLVIAIIRAESPAHPFKIFSYAIFI